MYGGVYILWQQIGFGCSNLAMYHHLVIQYSPHQIHLTHKIHDKTRTRRRKYKSNEVRRDDNKEQKYLKNLLVYKKRIKKERTTRSQSHRIPIGKSRLFNRWFLYSHGLSSWSSSSILLVLVLVLLLYLYFFFEVEGEVGDNNNDAVSIIMLESSS